MCRGLKHTTAAFVSQRNKNQDKNKNTPTTLKEIDQRDLFTSVPARGVALRARCPGPLGSCSPVCPLGVLCCVCGV